jgi:outer membrane lipoprotein carrier protein
MRTRFPSLPPLALLVALMLLGGPLRAADSDASAADEKSDTRASAPGEKAPGPAGEVCDDARAAEVVALVQARYDAIRDIEAEFEQVSNAVVMVGASLAESETSRGKVNFAKPGKMHWAYVEPEPSHVISDGKTLWIYDVGARQASRMPMAQGHLAGAALQFLLGEGQLAEAFTILPIACKGAQVDLELFPKEPAGYERLGMRANVQTGLIEQTAIVDLFGNLTQISFIDTRVDIAPDVSVFSFTPPEGVEVIDLAPPE